MRGEARRGGRSDAQGHVTEQPLLGAAVVAVSQGGHHLVLLRRHVQTLVAVHMQQGESLGTGGRKQLHRREHIHLNVHTHTKISNLYRLLLELHHFFFRL